MKDVLDLIPALLLIYFERGQVEGVGDVNLCLLFSPPPPSPLQQCENNILAITFTLRVCRETQHFQRFLISPGKLPLVLFSI